MKNALDCYYDYKSDKFIPLEDIQQKNNEDINLLIEELRQYINLKNEQNINGENEILKENAIHNDKIVDKARWNETIYKSRIDNAIEFIETNPLIWNPNMELTNLIENPNFKDMLYYKPDEWLHKLHTILKGDDENGESKIDTKR